jgi:hypothetical protein
MGASDENGLTNCDDFSFLLVVNNQTSEYTTINAPINQENHSTQKFATLFHDSGSEEQIYSAKVINDSLNLGIKVAYQEGYGAYTLKTGFKDQFAKSILTNLIRFEEENKYNELK